METLPPVLIIAGIAAGFLIAGVIKGAFGIGFPAVLMSILPFLIDPAVAIALLALPIIVTNFQQMVSMPGWAAIVKRFLVAGAASAVTILIVAQFLDKISSDVITLLVGLALIVFSITGLFKVQLPVTENWKWQLGVGVGSGIIGGMTGIKVPTMIYTAALNLPRDAFVVAAGFLFFCSGSGLFASVLAGNLLSGPALLVSVFGVFAALAGFRIGELIRVRLNPALFRQLLLWLMLVLGVRMVITSLLN